MPQSLRIEHAEHGKRLRKIDPSLLQLINQRFFRPLPLALQEDQSATQRDAHVGHALPTAALRPGLYATLGKQQGKVDVDLFFPRGLGFFYFSQSSLFAIALLYASANWFAGALVAWLVLGFVVSVTCAKCSICSEDGFPPRIKYGASFRGNDGEIVRFLTKVLDDAAERIRTILALGFE